MIKAGKCNNIYIACITRLWEHRYMLKVDVNGCLETDMHTYILG